MSGFAAVGLDNPKSGINVGAALRACHAYDAAILVASGKRFGGRQITDTTSAWASMPFLQVQDLHDAIPYDCVPVAVELSPDAKPLPSYVHPARAFYVFGAEDATLGARVLSWCRDLIYIPTSGCMNLAATVNVVLYDRLAKGA